MSPRTVLNPICLLVWSAPRPEGLVVACFATKPELDAALLAPDADTDHRIIRPRGWLGLPTHPMLTLCFFYTGKCWTLKFPAKTKALVGITEGSRDFRARVFFGEVDTTTGEHIHGILVKWVSNFLVLSFFWRLGALILIDIDAGGKLHF